MESKNPIQVTDKLFLTLETLAETGPITLAELCQRLELNKSTVHRLLASLSYVGYVKQDAASGKYMLTLKVLTLSNQVLGNIDILEIARPYIKQLSHEIGETVHLVQKDETDAIYIFKQESYQNSIRMASKVGSRVPLYCSGVGKAMLSYMDDEEIKKVWDASPVQKLTSHTITDPDQFFDVIHQVRRNGYALDNEENELGVRCIAAGIQDYSGKSRYAFSISAPSTRMDDDRILELSNSILKIKKAIEAELH